MQMVDTDKPVILREKLCGQLRPQDGGGREPATASGHGPDFTPR